MRQPGSFEVNAVIDASAGRVWQVITKPELMLQWMGDKDLELEVATSWQVGQPFVTRGFHHVRFENKGTILIFDPPHLLRYNHLSSVSRLADKPENYSIIEFRLDPVEGQTSLTIRVSGFPTESIFKHLEFYWRNTVGVIKKVAESRKDEPRQDATSIASPH
jgi:uncharacterized protein YndB with AHSA1/START domain